MIIAYIQNADGARIGTIEQVENSVRVWWTTSALHHPSRVHSTARTVFATADEAQEYVLCEVPDAIIVEV